MPFGYDAGAYAEMQNLSTWRESLNYDKMMAQDAAYKEAANKYSTPNGTGGTMYGVPYSYGGSTSSSGGGSSSSMPPPSGGGTIGGATQPAPYNTGITVGSTNPLSVQMQEQYDPWSRYRPQAGDQLAGKMGATSPSDIYRSKLEAMVSGQFSPDDPSYQWRFQQGQQATERSLAAKGLLNSGNAAIELQQYGQGAASQEYGAQFDRLLKGMSGTEDVYNTQMGRLMKMAGVDLDPTAGGKLAVQTGQLGVDQGKLGLAGQELSNRWAIDQSKLGLESQQLANQWALGNREADIKEQGVQNSNPMWQSIFNPSSGSTQQTASWDEIRAAKEAMNTAKDRQSYLDQASDIWS